MEINTELNFQQKIVDFIVIRYPEHRTSQFQLTLVGEEAPSTFIVSVDIYDPNSSSSSGVLILYECSFHNETPKSYTNLSYILQLQNKNDSIIKYGEEICFASLSSDRQFLGLTFITITNDEPSYSCCIVNISLIKYSQELSRLLIVQSLNILSKIQFIQTPIKTRLTKNSIANNNSFFKLQSTHILLSIEQSVIKYQRVLMSRNSAVIENENTLSSKLYYHALKSELDRLYILEKSTDVNFSLKVFQIMWPQRDEEEITIFEFQLLFSYQFLLPNQQVDISIINIQVLEHSNGTICLCHELKTSVLDISHNTYAYCVHMINSNNIIECRTPAYVTDPPGKILFTMYKSYVVVITKFFIHLIDIYCHSKQICSYIWPTCFSKNQFVDLRCLNSIKMANMYFLQDTQSVLSVRPNLYNIAEMIKESGSISQKVGAINFIVYNHLWKTNEKNVAQIAMEFVLDTVKNSFTISRLMEEYITASVNRYLRIKVTQERIMKYIDNTTLSSQFSSKLLSIISPENIIIENDVIKINIQVVSDEALVIFVKDDLPNPQINRFLRLSSESSVYNYNSSNPDSAKIELVFDNNLSPDEVDLPEYLTKMTLTDDQTHELDLAILQKIGNIAKVHTVNSDSLVNKIRICTVRAWKKLLHIIHKTVFDDELTLWNELILLKRPVNPKINCFHLSLGAFRYLLLKEKLSIPASIEEMYFLTSYNVLSDQRFLIYLMYSEFLCISNISLDIFKEFYKKLSSTPENDVLVRIKEKMISKMSMDTKMSILSFLNKDDKDQVVKEYWDNVNRRTNVFNRYYAEITHSSSRSCDTPHNALDYFYRQSRDKIELNETLK